ncbi:aminotransferase class I/II-fold pyridoxal phosphate-dependent enzyme [Actibacterium pelagium]|uniref:8-amino-7-oxononanoate synthase/2-amino-3-ketobutyrate coenzyme A ligase n=1 Tax=Actibacterium pelagium TaxID=2029103 RepID=A0A917EPA2_9RHOB|nr:pyridoxal phosphate-dependent aminotransferase family protein [Actibacterium pelagium]GGE61919.1 8-amino-7-oxononanoate synthase/2-amino-3-ketobutyrate coenzyme A ligase [Actibacterium pelagium]
MTEKVQSPADRIKTLVQMIKASDLYPVNPIVNSATTEPVIWVDGRDHLLFCSNNLLGLSNHPDVKEAAAKALDRYGLGSGGSRQMAANIDVHRALELRIAEHLGREDAICYTTGYMANVGTVPALIMVDLLQAIAASLLGKSDLVPPESEGSSWEVFSEQLNHASLVDGVRLARADVSKFPHKDTARLKKQLEASDKPSKFVVSDGVFSMDGDIAPIPEIARLAKKHNAMLMIDDAHGVGMLGENGRGSLEHLGVSTSDVDLQMGTFTKAFGGVGGYVAGDRDLIDFLRISARSYIFSAPLPPSIAAGVAEAIDVAEKEPWRREKAMENAFYFRREVESLGYDTLGSEAHIVPALIGNELKAAEVTKMLRHRGIVAPHARYPAVAPGMARIRFVMTCQHEREQIDYLLKCLAEVREQDA